MTYTGEACDDFGEGAVPDELQDMKALRRELKKLRRGREVLTMRVKKARRELARTRRRQKEAERILMENEAAIAVTSQRLGCAVVGLPEIDEWKELAREHRLHAKELQQQIEDERDAHAERQRQLKQELEKGGRPATAKSAETAESQARRWAADESCGHIQAIRDYVSGDLQGINLQDLRELVSPSLSDGSSEDDAVFEIDDYADLIEVVLEELDERHKQNRRDIGSLFNTVIGRKNSLLNAIADRLLVRGLEDVKLCTPAERNTLRELLQDVESVCASRLMGRSRFE